MKHLKKVIAVLLTVIMLSSLALPVISYAEAGVPNDHTTFEEFWEQMTDEEGNIDWTKLPKVLFKAFVWIRLFEAIASFFRNLFGIGTPAEDVPETTTAVVEETVPAESTTLPVAA